jgi:hypothetical protein
MEQVLIKQPAEHCQPHKGSRGQANSPCVFLDLQQAYTTQTGQVLSSTLSLGNPIATANITADHIEAKPHLQCCISALIIITQNVVKQVRLNLSPAASTQLWPRVPTPSTTRVTTQHLRHSPPCV